ncbi:hypothetical protein [Streptomyces sp. NPDC059894]|uniref:hypothetical protein n=1 Tax=unclassified Streptomyces TaxID=2593676 RepID=UPI00364E77DD
MSAEKLIDRDRLMGEVERDQEILGIRIPVPPDRTVPLLLGRRHRHVHRYVGPARGVVLLTKVRADIPAQDS